MTIIEDIQPNDNGAISLVAIENNFNNLNADKAENSAIVDMVSSSANLTDGEIVEGDGGVKGVKTNGVPTSSIRAGIGSGWAEGCEISATTATTATIDPGIVFIVDNDTGVITPVAFAGDTVTITGVATDVVTFLCIDINGDVTQFTDLLTSEEARQNVRIGSVSHALGTVTTSNNTKGNIAFDSNFANDLTISIGELNQQGGNEFTGNSGTMTMQKSAGLILGSGINAANDKNDPNTVRSAALPTVSKAYTWKDGSGGYTFSALDTDLVSGVYDDGTGGVGVPNGVVQDWQYTVQRNFWFANAGVSVVEHGQEVYDTLTDAIDAVRCESFEVNPVLFTGAYRTSVIVRGDATDAGDATQVLFEDMGVVADRTASLCTPSGVGNMSPFANGIVITEEPDITVSSPDAGTTIELEIKRGNSEIGDLTVQFDGLNYTAPADTVTLTQGSDTSPQANYVYYVNTLGTITLEQDDNGFPNSGEYAEVATVLVQSGTSCDSDGPYSLHKWAEGLGNGTGHLNHINRTQNENLVKYLSGANYSFTIDNGPSPGTVDVSVASGTARVGFEPLNFPSFNTASGTEIYVVNDPTTPYTKITDLNQLTQDAEGNSLTGNYRANFVFFVDVNNTTGESKLYMNLPNGTYSNNAQAERDDLRTAVYTFPAGLETTSMLAVRLVLRRQNSGGGDFTNLAEQDLRGLFGQALGTGGSSQATTFVDNTFRIFDDIDDTKQIAFETSGITTATTRTYTAPDASGTITLDTPIDGITYVRRDQAWIDIATIAIASAISVDTSSFNGILSAADDTVQKALDTIDDSGGGGASEFFIIQDQKSSGTGGGASTSATWHTRDLNTTIENSITGASLSSNQITLPIGTYLIHFYSTSFDAGGFKARLQNITDATTDIIGASGNCDTSDPSNVLSIGTGYLTLAGSKDFELQLRTASTNANGLGFQASAGINEVYSEITIEKVA